MLYVFYYKEKTPQPQHMLSSVQSNIVPKMFSRDNMLFFMSFYP